MKFIQYIFMASLVVCIIQKLDAQNNAKKPNILFAISDDQSYYHTSKAGCNFISTPAMDRIANEGAYFYNCYSSSPGCAPARSALVTGRHHWQNEQAGQHASAWLKKYVPFVDEFEEQGYVTGRTGKGVRPFRYARNEKDSLWRSSDAGGKEHSYFKVSSSNDERFGNQISNIDYFANFKYFIDSVKDNNPFFFWYGGKEPHRAFEEGSWKKMGKSLDDVEVPEFLPDNDIIRGDLLDYAVEIEWFDLHLQRMLEYLESIGELDNTMVIVTSDNGMAFPRAKANCYEYGVHVPLAIRYPVLIAAGKTIETPVSFIDLAPTFFEFAQITPEHMMPITGESIMDIFTENNKDTERAVYSGRERHSSSRYNNYGYPQRSVRKGDYLFVWNIKPDRWPAGAPQRYESEDTTKLLPLFSLDTNGRYAYGGIFADIDDSPSKTYLIESNNDEYVNDFFNYSTEKRPEFELFNIKEDHACLQNLANKAKFSSVANELKSLLIAELKRTNDSRIIGPDYEIFDSYMRYSRMRYFPKP